MSKNTILYSFVFAILIFTIHYGCDNNKKQNTPKDKTKPSELTEESESEKSMELDRKLCNQYDAVLFPSKEIDCGSNTLEMQNFFKENKRVLFHGFFDDIYEKDSSIIILMYCVLDELFCESAIMFSLSLPKNKVNIFKNEKRDRGVYASLSPLSNEGKYYIVCDLISVKKDNFFVKFSDFGSEESGSILNIPLMVNGILISAENVSPRKSLFDEVLTKDKK